LVELSLVAFKLLELKQTLPEPGSATAKALPQVSLDGTCANKKAVHNKKIKLYNFFIKLNLIG
jgi:hypothetical protein